MVVQDRECGEMKEENSGVKGCGQDCCFSWAVGFFKTEEQQENGRLEEGAEGRGRQSDCQQEEGA